MGVSESKCFWMVCQCRKSSELQTTGVQLLSKHHFPQTWDHLSEDPSLTHPCFHFSLFIDKPLVKQVQQMGSDSPSSHPMCTHHAWAITLEGSVPEPLRCCSRMKALLPPISSRSRAVLTTKILQAQDHQSDPAMGPSYTFPFAPLQISNTHWGTRASFLPSIPVGNFKCSESWRIWAAMTHLSPLPASLVCAHLPLPITHRAAWAVLVTGLMLISGNSHGLSLGSHHLLQLQQWPSLQESPWPPDSFRRDTVDCFLLSARRPWYSELWKHTVLVTTLWEYLVEGHSTG